MILTILTCAAGGSARGQGSLLPVHDIPAQDAGLPYTASGRQRALAALRPYVALFATATYSSRYAYAEGYKVRLDDGDPLRGEPQLREGTIFVSAAFGNVLVLPQFTPPPAPAYLREKWVYQIRNERERTDAAPAKYVSLDELARANGWQVQRAPRGLILLSRTPRPFRADAALLDSIVTLFDTPEKLADPDIATRHIPTLRAQGKWTDHVSVTPEQGPAKGVNPLFAANVAKVRRELTMQRPS